MRGPWWAASLTVKRALHRITFWGLGAGRSENVWGAKQRNIQWAAAASAPPTRLAQLGAPSPGPSHFTSASWGARAARLQRPQAQKAPTPGLCAARALASQPFHFLGPNSRESVWKDRKLPAPRARPAARPGGKPGGGRRPEGLGLRATAAPRSASGPRPWASRPTLCRTRPAALAPSRPRPPALPPGPDRCGRRRAEGRAGCCRARWAAGNAPARSAASGPGRSSGAAPSLASAAWWWRSPGRAPGSGRPPRTSGREAAGAALRGRRRGRGFGPAPSAPLRGAPSRPALLAAAWALWAPEGNRPNGPRPGLRAGGPRGGCSSRARRLPQPRLSFSPPYNRTGVEMPGRGGNHAEDLRETKLIQVFLHWRWRYVLINPSRKFI